MLGINWTTWVAIGAGSACGGVLRQLLTEVVTRVVGPGFPWGTLLVNVSGSAAMGFVVAIVAGGMPAAWSVTARHFVMTGVLGGFTTFSSFSVQTLALMQQGHWQAAALNSAGSLILCVGACWVGYASVLAFSR